MAIVIDLSPELENRYRALPAKRGQEAAEYARSLIERDVNEHAEPFTEDLEEPEDPDALDRAIAAMINRTQEQIDAARTRAISLYKPITPPAPGTNGVERVYGHWPGDETNEEIFRALEELS